MIYNTFYIMRYIFYFLFSILYFIFYIFISEQNLTYKQGAMESKLICIRAQKPKRDTKIRIATI